MRPLSRFALKSLGATQLLFAGLLFALVPMGAPARAADDVECKDGQYDMTLDKDFKITGKKKEDSFARIWSLGFPPDASR